ncbi:MAG: host attachment protein [Betaproteobacteria bacterium]|nr:host attachment protein [Betaproteobacteria bacterium]
MASTTWILVANASLAKLYANHGPKKGLALVKEYEHPESRQKNAELVTDRAGYMQSSGNGHGARQPQTEPKQNEMRNFAHELASELNSGRTTNRMQRIILVAPPAFMGLMNTVMDDQTSQLVTDRLEKDYTKAPPKDLASHLEACIYL